MKIFFPIGAFYPSQIGGPCNTVYSHTCELRKNGVDVNIVTTTLGIIEGKVQENTTIHNECGTVYYGKGHYNDVQNIIKSLKHIKFADIIHLNGLFDLMSIATFFYSKLFFSTKKIIISTRGQLNSKALQFGKIKKVPLIMLYKFFSKNVLFHATSESEENDIKTLFKTRDIINIPNFLTLNRRFNLKIKNQVLFLGRIHEIKGLHKLINGVGLSKEFIKNDFVLKIAGIHENRYQDYFDSLKNLTIELGLANKVEFLGHVSGEEKDKLYAESYVLALVSETENFGNVVVEALNQGTPVITSKGTPWSNLEERKCGYHIDNSPEVISQYIDKIIALDSEKYHEMRINAKDLIDDKFNIEVGVKQWLKVYNSLL